MNYEANVKNYIIKNFNTILSDEEKLEYIKDMIEYYTNLNIHEDFPNDILIKTFYPVLSLYLYSKYSLNPNKRLSCKRLLTVCLKKYKKNGCLYGRKIYEHNKFDKTNFYFITHV